MTQHAENPPTPLPVPSDWEPVHLNAGAYIGPVADTIQSLLKSIGQIRDCLNWGVPLSPAGLRTWAELSACLEHDASDLRDLVAYLQDLEDVERHL